MQDAKSLILKLRSQLPEEAEELLDELEMVAMDVGEGEEPMPAPEGEMPMDEMPPMMDEELPPDVPAEEEPVAAPDVPAEASDLEEGEDDELMAPPIPKRKRMK